MFTRGSCVIVPAIPMARYVGKFLSAGAPSSHPLEFVHSNKDAKEWFDKMSK